MIFKNKFNEVRSRWKILLVFLLTFGITFTCSMIMAIILGVIILSNGNTDQLMNINLDSIGNNELIFIVSNCLGNISYILACIIIWKVFE